MGAFSKGWSSIKKTVKKVAKGVKEFAKKTTQALPGGKELWDFGSRTGGKIMEGFGKVANALGPVGMMALSVVLAPIMAPMLATMWAGFGAGAGAMVGATNQLVNALGQAGTAIFNGAQHLGGTMGAMGDAFSKGITQVAKGNFSGASKVFMENMKSAFTGNAGQASVAAGQKAILDQSVNQTLASLAQDQATNAVVPDIMNKFGLEGMTLESAGAQTQEQLLKQSLDSQLTSGGANAFDPLRMNMTPEKALSDNITRDISSANAFAPSSSSASATHLAPESGGGLLKGAAKVGSALLGGGGGMASESPFVQPVEVGRKFHATDAAGIAESIRAAGDSSLFNRLIQGSFA